MQVRPVWWRKVRRVVLALSFVLLAIFGGAWLVTQSGDSRLIASARQIKVGQSEDDVRELLGDPHLTFTMPVPVPLTTRLYGRSVALRLKVKELVGRIVSLPPQPFTSEDWPVEVHFIDGRVDSCRSGRDVVAGQPAGR